MVLYESVEIVLLIGFALKVAVKHFLKNNEIFYGGICSDSITQLELFKKPFVVICKESIKFPPDFVNFLSKMYRRLEYRMKTGFYTAQINCQVNNGITPQNASYNVKKHSEGFSLKEYIEERAIGIANYIIENNATVRQTAKAFGISKSTVHKDVTDRLMQINPTLARQARKVLNINKSERHIRGGLATREKYLHQRG